MIAAIALASIVSCNGGVCRVPVLPRRVQVVAVVPAAVEQMPVAAASCAAEVAEPTCAAQSAVETSCGSAGRLVSVHRQRHRTPLRNLLRGRCGR